MKVPQPREEFQFEWLVLIPTRQRFDSPRIAVTSPRYLEQTTGRCQIVSALLIGRSTAIAWVTSARCLR
jgi:hypothetical protein